MTDTPEPLIREFQSRTDAHTAENLEKTRKVLKRAQGMNWIIRKESRGDHKWPCFAVHDVEWLFGFIDAKDAEIARLYDVIDRMDRWEAGDWPRRLAAAEEKVAALEAENDELKNELLWRQR